MTKDFTGIGTGMSNAIVSIGSKPLLGIMNTPAMSSKNLPSWSNSS